MECEYVAARGRSRFLDWLDNMERPTQNVKSLWGGTYAGLYVRRNGKMGGGGRVDRRRV